jgi:hypothetical protein
MTLNKVGAQQQKAVPNCQEVQSKSACAGVPIIQEERYEK